MSNKELIAEIRELIAAEKKIDGDTPELCVVNLIENFCDEEFLERVRDKWERIVSEDLQEGYEILSVIYSY